MSGFKKWQRLIYRARKRSELRSKILFRRMIKRRRKAGLPPLMTVRSFKRMSAPIIKKRQIETLRESRMMRNRDD